MGGLDRPQMRFEVRMGPYAHPGRVKPAGREEYARHGGRDRSYVARGMGAQRYHPGAGEVAHQLPHHQPQYPQDPGPMAMGQG